MKPGFSSQYHTGVVILSKDDTSFIKIKKAAHDYEALYNDGKDQCFVIQFPDRPIELYTETALRRSLREKKKTKKRNTGIGDHGTRTKTQTDL
jgi:hypothetical protein